MPKCLEAQCKDMANKMEICLIIYLQYQNCLSPASTVKDLLLLLLMLMLVSKAASSFNNDKVYVCVCYNISNCE